MSTANSLDTILDGHAPTAASEPAPVSQPERSPDNREPATGETQETLAPPAGSAIKEEPREAQRIPVKALEDERRKRQDLERQLQEMQKRIAGPPRQDPQAPPPQQPDWFVEPERAAQHMMAQMEERRLNDRANMSERIAVRTHGAELVEEAKRAAIEAGVGRYFFVNSADPYDDLITWHRKQKFVSEIGDDPEAYKQRLREELMAELGQGNPQPPPSAVPPPAPGARPKAPVPKSLAAQPSAQPRDDRGRWSQGPVSLSQILD